LLETGILIEREAGTIPRGRTQPPRPSM